MSQLERDLLQFLLLDPIVRAGEMQMSKLRTMLIVGFVALSYLTVAPCNAQQTANSQKGSHEHSHSSSDYHHHHSRSNLYRSPYIGYYPYVVPYNYGYSGYGGYPFYRPYASYGYPVNLNSGLERGFLYGNTYINPNFGN